jgi:hypothetical protein
METDLENTIKKLKSMEDVSLYENFSIVDLNIIEKKKYTFSFEKQEIADKASFKDELGKMIELLENSDSKEEINIGFFFELYKRLDHFIFSINLLQDIIKKTLKSMEANKLIQKEDIRLFNDSIINNILQGRDFFKFENSNDVGNRIGEEDMFFFNLFLNNYCKLDLLSQRSKEDSEKLWTGETALVIKRVIANTIYTIKINESFITLEINNYSKSNEKIIFDEIDFFLKSLKKISLNYEMNTLKSIKIGSKSLKINKKKIYNYLEYFNDGSKVKIIFVK